MIEEWKDVKGYEGLYQISNLGNVKSLSRKVHNYIKKEKLLKPRKKENGYLQVYLYKDLKKNKYIHRLVAEAFLDNPYNKGFVNHIDFNKQNNSVENLEWVSRIENFRHYKNSNKWNETYENRNKKIASRTLNKANEFKGKIITLYKQNFSIKEIAEKLNLGRDFVSDILYLFDIT